MKWQDFCNKKKWNWNKRKKKRRNFDSKRFETSSDKVEFDSARFFHGDFANLPTIGSIPGGLVWPKAGTQLLDAKWEKKREGNGRIKMKGKTKKGRRTVRNDRRGIRTAPKSWTIFNCHTSVTRSKPRLIVFSFHFFFFTPFTPAIGAFRIFHGCTEAPVKTRRRNTAENQKRLMNESRTTVHTPCFYSVL